MRGSPSKASKAKRIAPHSPHLHERSSTEIPLRPSGGRGRGPSRSDGRVRWVPASALESPASPRPSPPPGVERENFVEACRPRSRTSSLQLLDLRRGQEPGLGPAQQQIEFGGFLQF